MDFGTEASEKGIYLVQRKIACLTFIAGFLVSIINFVNFLSEYSITEAIAKPAVFFLLIISLITLLTGFKDCAGFRIIQVVLAFLTSAFAIMDVYNSIHGLGLIMLAFFLAFKYGFLKRRLLLKIILSMSIVFALVMLSAQLDYQGGGVMFGLNAVIYLTAFLMITYIIYQDEITAYIIRNREAEDEISALQDERRELAGRLEALDNRIAEFADPVDLEGMGLTRKEMEVLEALIFYRETEHQLAERLGISFHTLKNHFRHIRDKLGVDKREDIIERCRHSFLSQILSCVPPGQDLSRLPSSA